MTEKEFRKLKSLDLIQMLLTQNNEEVWLQEELEKKKGYLAVLHENNDKLKTELDDRDTLIETLKQQLNENDANIQNLKEELQILHEDMQIDMSTVGSITDAAQKVNEIFETAQKEAEAYMARINQRLDMPGISENYEQNTFILENIEEHVEDGNKNMPGRLNQDKLIKKFF